MPIKTKPTRLHRGRRDFSEQGENHDSGKDYQKRPWCCLGKEESEYLISPAVAKIKWILRGQDNIERDYMIASCPFILAVDRIYDKIRNLKYRYINPEHKTLFPEEIDTYEPYVIREALNNAIAHQDYTLGGQINVVEYDDKLVFSNKGSFIPGNIERVLVSDAPEERYRNQFW